MNQIEELLYQVNEAEKFGHIEELHDVKAAARLLALEAKYYEQRESGVSS